MGWVTGSQPCGKAVWAGWLWQDQPAAGWPRSRSPLHGLEHPLSYWPALHSGLVPGPKLRMLLIEESVPLLQLGQRLMDVSKTIYRQQQCRPWSVRPDGCNCHVASCCCTGVWLSTHAWPLLRRFCKRYALPCMSPGNRQSAGRADPSSGAVKRGGSAESLKRISVPTEHSPRVEGLSEQADRV